MGNGIRGIFGRGIFVTGIIW